MGWDMLRRALLLSALLLTACGEAAKTPGDTAAAPAAPVIEAKPAPDWKRGAMVAAANPLAVEAGLAVLRKGGSAVDAAIAVQTVLGLVEPQSSGLGGGAFLIHYDAATGDVTAYDGRETAPAGATPTMFLNADGTAENFLAAVQSGDAVGTPGLMSLLALAHGDHGKLPLGDDVAAAVKLAADGFPVPARMATVIQMAAGYGPMLPDAAAYLMPDGAPLAAGTVIKNAAYADTLTRFAAEGPKGFYEGPVAEAIVAAVHRGNRPGTLSLEDLKGYSARRLEPLCRTYRADLVCGMGPPSSGGLGVLAALGMLSHFDMAANGPTTATGWNLFIEASRLAYADRDLYAADDRFVAVPIEGMLDPAYLADRAKLIVPDHAMADAPAGTPPGAPKRAADLSGRWTGTSHFVVVDAKGNVVSMTTTIEGPFGAQRMAGGFFLNNQMTDFSFLPVDAKGVAIANAVAPGKKPRSSMAPTIIFRDGHFRLAVGSPGGNAIIAYVLKSIVGMEDWGLSPQDAVALPNVVARGKPIIEASFDPALRAQLAAMGQQISDARAGEASGLHAVMVMPDGHLAGGADPRREGVAAAP
ncbi:Glutathione hydrolase proenzyme [Alphaproteobacteria bacterium SO-S41]|nr:Glutathione hydrolase proenzyme [Alphaproteobacteria bacterium SO-S41]